MNNYVQNNFNESSIAKEGKSNKPMIIVTIILTVAMFIVFKHAIGG